MPIHPLQFLDCNCGVGPYAGGDDSTDALVRKMDSLGVAEAMPFALSEYEANMGEGNARLAADTAAVARLHPAWVAIAHQCGEGPTPDELFEQMSRHDVRMIRIGLHKTTFSSDLDLCLLEDLFDRLAPHRIIVYIDCRLSFEQVKTQTMKTLLRTWADMPVVLGVPKIEMQDRVFYYLWERFDNFLIELSGYQVLGGIEAVFARFGSDRIVFGTRYPHFTPLQTMLQIIYSRVEESVKKDIAGATMRRLLGEVRL